MAPTENWIALEKTSKLLLSELNKGVPGYMIEFLYNKNDPIYRIGNPSTNTALILISQNHTEEFALKALFLASKDYATTIPVLAIRNFAAVKQQSTIKLSGSALQAYTHNKNLQEKESGNTSRSASIYLSNLDTPEKLDLVEMCLTKEDSRESEFMMKVLSIQDIRPTQILERYLSRQKNQTI